MNPPRRAGLDGLIAVAAFAATLPLTRIALEGFPPLPLTFARLAGAAALALICLVLLDAPRPAHRHWLPLAAVALGGVYGFPLLTALALEGREAAPAAIPLALMPLATAAWTRLRGHEHPARRFWLWAAAGAAVVLHFIHGGVLSGVHDGVHGGPVAPELFGAALCAAVAYAEGGALAREMPGWQVMGWALLLAAPGTALGLGHTWAGLALPDAPAPWLALAFLAAVTQFGAFWFWYRALAAGVARGAQLQLLQPFLTLLLAAALLGEAVTPQLWLYAAAVVATVHLARRAAHPQPERSP